MLKLQLFCAGFGQSQAASSPFGSTPAAPFGQAAGGFGQASIHMLRCAKICRQVQLLWAILTLLLSPAAHVPLRLRNQYGELCDVCTAADLKLVDRKN